MKDRHVLSPPGEVRLIQENLNVDAHGDTWDETGTIKIAFADPHALLARQDDVRKQMREDLDAEGIRELYEHDEELGYSVLKPGARSPLQFGCTPTTERVAKLPDLEFWEDVQKDRVVEDLVEHKKSFWERLKCLLKRTPTE